MLACSVVLVMVIWVCFLIFPRFVVTCTCFAVLFVSRILHNNSKFMQVHMHAVLIKKTAVMHNTCKCKLEYYT